MGVRGLQSFMERSGPNVASKVNIKVIVETYRRETGRDAVIVVDGSSCMRPLYGELDWICGGQIKEFVEIFKNFIQAFVDIGVKLVFFFDGPTQERKRGVWIKRRLNHLQDVFIAFDLLENGSHPSHIKTDSMMLPPGAGNLARFAIKTSQGCEVHRSVNECDEEIEEYAVKNKCFAILGQDSDFVIYDGPPYYLSSDHLNIEQMTTIYYNRQALAQKLQLSPCHLPLLASLVGNDIVPSDELLHFHRNICQHTSSRRSYNRPHSHDVIYKVAHFIRENTDVRHLYEDLPRISRSVFGSEQRALQLRTSVGSYSINTNLGKQQEKLNFDDQPSDAKIYWKQIQKFTEKRYRNEDIDSMVYAVIHDIAYESSTGVEDFRRTDLPSAAGVYRPLRQHIYGIILSEKPGDSADHVVEEWCMEGTQSLNKAARVSIIAPQPGSHPGLMTLWNEEDTSEELLTKKWTLVANAVSKHLDPDRLRSVPPTLLAPTLLLYFLYHEGTPFLESWEVEAFIATAVMLPTYSTASLSALQILRAIPRAVQLACIFGRGSSIIKMLMDVCGRPIPAVEVSAWHYFDGKLFQTLYQKAKSGKNPMELCNHQETQLEQFNLMQSIVLSSQE